MACAECGVAIAQQSSNALLSVICTCDKVMHTSAWHTYRILQILDLYDSDRLGQRKASLDLGLQEQEKMEEAEAAHRQALQAHGARESALKTQTT